MSAPLGPRTIADLGTDPPVPALIANVCRPTGSIILFGRTGVGKTRLLWQLACAWSHGQDIFGLAPARPLRITFVEADMYRSDFESVIREGLTHSISPAPSLAWFARDDDSLMSVQGRFGKVLAEYNNSVAADLTIYDAIPDVTVGDPNDMRVAMDALRALSAAAGNRAYLGALVQRKGLPQEGDDEDVGNLDSLFGSQGWGRQASTIWRLTSKPSLLWVKHRLCAKPPSIVLAMSPSGWFLPKSAGAQGLILSEAQRGYTSVRELAERLLAHPAYQALPHRYQERALRDFITTLIQSGRIPPPVSRMGELTPTTPCGQQ